MAFFKFICWYALVDLYWIRLSVGVREEFENEEGIHRSSETGIEDEANEEEKDLKSFSSSELTSWEQERDSKVDNKKNKDDSELSNDTVRMYLKEIGKVKENLAKKESPYAFFLCGHRRGLVGIRG